MITLKDVECVARGATAMRMAARDDCAYGYARALKKGRKGAL